MSRPFPYGAPPFAALAPWLGKLQPPWPAAQPGAGGPDSQAVAGVAALAAELGLVTCNGHALRFVLPQEDGLGYEARIAARGEVETRAENWHDFFNALVWCAFPRSKAALSGRHQAMLTGATGAGRGLERDAMTHFDECGAVVLSTRPDLLDLIREFRWKELFWERRTDLAASLRCVIFGHATYEQLLAPFRGLTAKAVLYEVSAAELAAIDAGQLAGLDARLAAELAAGCYASPRELQPLPLLGLPGMTPENETAAYYDDTWQFRSGRRAASTYNGAVKLARQPLGTLGCREESPGSAEQDAG